MSDVTVDSPPIREIAALTNPHLKSSNDATTAHWPTMPDAYLTLALGFEVAVLLNSLLNVSDPTQAVAGITRAQGVDGVNVVLRTTDIG